jgi:hypothetical protein
MRKEDVIIRVLLETCDEVGLVNGRQAFAASMCQSIMQLIKEKKLNYYQVMLIIGWDGRFVFGNKLSRRRIASVLMPKLRAALELYERPASIKAQRIRAAQWARE